MKAKKIFSLLLTVCLSAMLLPTIAFAAGAPVLTTGGTPTFSADEGYTAADVPEQYVTIYVNDTGVDAVNLTVTLNDATHFIIKPTSGDEASWDTSTMGVLKRNANVAANSNVQFAVQPQTGIEAGTYNTTVGITADQVTTPLSVDVSFTVSRQSFTFRIDKEVVQAGNVNPPAKTFELEFGFVDGTLTEGDLAITGKTIATNGAGGFATDLEITGAADKMTLLKSGFFIREKNDGARNWTYSNKSYYAFHDGNVWVIGEGTNIPATGAAPSLNTISFTNTYTENRTSHDDDDDDINYVIDAWADAGGSISPEGRVVVSEGADKKFTIRAGDGYRIQKVVVDGEDKGALDSYTFKNVTRDHTIKAYFSKTGGSANPDTGAASPAGSGIGLGVGAVVLMLAAFTVKKE